METIDLTPTPEGMRHSIQRFEEQIAKSEHLIKVAEGWLELTDVERRVYVGDVFLDGPVRAGGRGRGATSPPPTTAPGRPAPRSGSAIAGGRSCIPRNSTSSP